MTLVAKNTILKSLARAEILALLEASNLSQADIDDRLVRLRKSKMSLRQLIKLRDRFVSEFSTNHFMSNTHYSTGRLSSDPRESDLGMQPQDLSNRKFFA